MTARLKRGDYIRIRRDDTDEWVEAFIALASDSDPSSVVVMFNGAVRVGKGFAVNHIPLWIHYADEKVIGLMTPDEYQIEVKP